MPPGYDYVAKPQQPQVDPQLEFFRQEGRNFSCPPHFIRMTTNKAPNSVSVHQKSNVPLAATLQPMAPNPGGYPEVPTVNLSSVGSVVRCKRCRTYINPFVVWNSAGRAWTCNLCGTNNETPNAYFSNLDDMNQRADRYERPELSQGVVEYIASGEYMVRPPQPPVFMFLLEVSLGAVQSGALEMQVQAIKHVLENELLPGGMRTQVGIMTYDSTIHFYNLSPNLSQPQMIVVSDLSDIFLPLPEEILANLQDSEQALLQLLDSLPGCFRNTKTTESCLHSAVEAASLAMKHIGGKIVACVSTIPTLGACQLKSNRDNRALLNTDREHELLKPINDVSRERAIEYTKHQIAVDLFVCASNFVDLASMYELCKSSGGDLHYYPQFNGNVHGQKLKNEMTHCLSREMGWEGVMRVRVSTGYKITKFHGHMYIRGTDLVVLPNCHADQSMGITIEPDEQKAPGGLVCVQAALLYTNSDGERRIRVSTLCQETTSFPQEVIGGVDPIGITHYLAASAIQQVLGGKKVSEARAYLLDACRGLVGAQALQNSEDLRRVPRYVMGLIKSVAWRATSDVGPDMRIAAWSRLLSGSGDVCSAICYPRMVGLHTFTEGVGYPDENGFCVLPDPLALSSESMSQDGAYILEDGDAILIWIGRGISAHFLYAVFGVSALDQLNPEVAETLIGTTGDPLGQRVANVIEGIRKQRRPPFMAVTVIRQGDYTESRFFQMLIEDRTTGLTLTFAEFMKQMGGRTTAPQPQSQQPGQMPPPPANGMMR
jgi:protein transport protein SEC24